MCGALHGPWKALEGSWKALQGMFLEGPSKVLVWPLGGPWQALGKPSEGRRKVLERQLEGPCKVHARHKPDHFMHAIIEAPGKRRIVLQH